MTNKQRSECLKAEIKALEVLKKGDKVRCTKCPGNKRNFIFSHFAFGFMISKSGIGEYHPINIDKINGIKINFKNI
jgi:hypothetical protein